MTAYSFDIYLVQGLHGLVYGMLLFLVASGLTLVFGMMGVLNLAHAGFYMLGAYVAYSVVAWSGNFWLSLIIAPIGVGLAGALVERFLLRKIHIHGHAYELLLTFGVFLAIGEIVKWFWGNSPLPVPVPPSLSGTLHLMGITYPYYRLFILCCGVVVLLLMALLLMKTRIGITIRAAVSDAEMVDALGTNVPVVFLGVFSIGSALAGLGGVIAGPFLTTYPGMGFDILLDTFVVIVVGGFGSLLGALVASVMIGELQSYGILILPDFALVFQFLLMAVVLIVRPTGLFGEKE
ncbi:MAG: branched-chain amino acid ABC transporter permease [Deltaproteobacteria bacterium]|nr:branched-chain amino acid ABC transporter permease [Deltaproteobacteria bacterium]